MSLSYNAKWLYGYLWSGQLPKKEEKPDFDVGVAPEEEVQSYLDEELSDSDDAESWDGRPLYDEDEDEEPEDDEEEYCDWYGCDMEVVGETDTGITYGCDRCGAEEYEDKEPVEITYYVRWKAFGVSEIKATSEDQAEEIFNEGIEEFDSIDFVYTRVDGYEFEVDDED